VIAAGGSSAAEQFVAREGLPNPVVVGKRQLLTPPARLREMLRSAGVDGVVVHSVDWRRQSNPQMKTPNTR
jgi:hypothetical protein